MPEKSNHRRKRKRRFRRRSPPGAVPGTLVADPEAPLPRIQVLRYSSDEFEEFDIQEPKEISDHLSAEKVIWVNVNGLGNSQVINKIGETFNLHPLALEDVLNVHQRAKVENYSQYLFIVARMLNRTQPLETEQISLFIGKHFVLTFQEKPGDCLEPIRKRLRNAHGHLRRAGADYLAYALLDVILDAYFPVLEDYGEQLDLLEDRVLKEKNGSVVDEIHRLRSDLLTIRRAIWPFRDALNTLIREPNPLIAQETQLYLRDCYDHSIQIIDVIETDREMCANLRELYLSTISQRTNEIMKVLTIIATIFIPLGFIAGVYGMNFDTQVSPWNMPELEWYFGYPFALGLMVLVAAGLVYFFWRHGWLGS